ncbi:EpsG family protein [Sphingobacterium sp. 2149]|uniref:EpsG family protein n=1 Tax=Sphingobacterium sp. 2149 TaxID=2817763 RepID=UPI00285A2312|nr:EpsG family protein [Sphingobacterium sp. 2149]MDR6733829.1 hypothetical protein [Sphingobacterium sp. 2149]
MKSNKAGRNLWYCITYVFFVCISGFRYKVGGDSLEYFNSFANQIPTLKDLTIDHFFTIRYEPFWIILNSICKTILNDFAILQLIHAIWINLVIFRFFKKNTKFLFTAILIYWLFFYFYFNMEILRESVAISFFLLAYPYLSSKKWVKYYLLVICAIMFHTSASFLIVLPLFRNQVLNKTNFIKIGCIVIGIIALFGVAPNLILGGALQQKFLIYQLFTPTFAGFTYYVCLYFFGPLFIYRHYTKYRVPLFRDIAVAYFAIAAIVSYLTGFSRFVNYFTPFMAVFLTNYIVLIFEIKKFRQVRSAVIFFIILISFIPKLLYYTQDTSDLVSDTHKYDLWFPYNSIFDKEENIKREQLFYRSFNKQ